MCDTLANPDAWAMGAGQQPSRGNLPVRKCQCTPKLDQLSLVKGCFVNLGSGTNVPVELELDSCESPRYRESNLDPLTKQTEHLITEPALLSLPHLWIPCSCLTSLFLPGYYVTRLSTAASKSRPRNQHTGRNEHFCSYACMHILTYKHAYVGSDIF